MAWGIRTVRHDSLSRTRLKCFHLDLWEVTTSLEVRQMSVLSEGALDIILSEQFTVDGLEKCSTDLHYEINTVLPTIDTW